MAKIAALQVLTEHEIEAIQDASCAILRETGVMVHHEEILHLLGEAGADVDAGHKIARLPEKLVRDSVARAGRQYVLHGRDPARVARFGYGERVPMSSPGQYAWIDLRTGRRRPATRQDAHEAIRLGDALDNITVVGAMAQPETLSEKYRDVVLTAELVKATGKPTRCWVRNGATARYILEIYRAVAGGDAALRARPMAEAFLEPISPLQLPGDGLDIVREFARAGQPVSIGPMAMTAGTAPAPWPGRWPRRTRRSWRASSSRNCSLPARPSCTAASRTSWTRGPPSAPSARRSRASWRWPWSRSPARTAFPSTSTWA